MFAFSLIFCILIKHYLSKALIIVHGLWHICDNIVYWKKYLGHRPIAEVVNVPLMYHNVIMGGLLCTGMTTSCCCTACAWLPICYQPMHCWTRIMFRSMFESWSDLHVNWHWLWQHTYTYINIITNIHTLLTLNNSFFSFTKQGYKGTGRKNILFLKNNHMDKYTTQIGKRPKILTWILLTMYMMFHFYPHNKLWHRREPQYFLP